VVERGPRASWIIGAVVAQLLLPTVVRAAGGPGRADPVEAARALLRAGDYAQGLNILVKESYRTRNSPARSARVFEAFATFYVQQVGDLDEGRRYLKKIMMLDLPPGNPQWIAARRALTRLRAQAERYKKADELLERISVERYEPEVLRSRVRALRALIARQPDFPRLASAYYYLGKNHQLLDEHGEAYRAYVRALELRPALGYHLPVEYSRDAVFKLLVRQDLFLAARVILAVVAGAVLVLLLLSRPWSSLGLRHGLVLLGLAALWWVSFKLAVWIAAETALVRTGAPPGPIQLGTALASPLYEVLDTLFLYGLAGVACAFVIAVATARFRHRWTWLAINAAATLLVLSSLMTLFYLRNGAVPFKPAGRERYAYLRGSFYFGTAEQEPFLLTDPMAYCKYSRIIDEMDEDELKRWFSRYARLCKER
jgi:tetratricopeptide (TPR) repeat protein